MLLYQIDSPSEHKRFFLITIVLADKLQIEEPDLAEELFRSWNDGIEIDEDMHTEIAGSQKI